MKLLMLVLLLITMIVSCGSDKTTDPFVPIDAANLIGTWNGSYALTYDAGTDSARTYEVEAQIIFADTSFTFTGEAISACATYGIGKYQVNGKILEFEDHSPRLMICDWANILHGQYKYGYVSNEYHTIDMTMTQSFDRYSWYIYMVKMPEIVQW